MAGETCAKCKRKPAFWHPATLTYLCGQHLSEYRKRFQRELAEDLKDQRQRRLAGPELALYWAAIVAASAVVWVVFVLALGLAP